MQVFRKRLLFVLAVIGLLLVQMALPAVAEVAGRPRFQGLSVTPNVSPGAALHITVQASMPDPNEGLCCGTILLTSPSGQQRLSLHLTLQGAGVLVADTTLPPGAEGGTWKVARLVLQGNGLAVTIMEAASDFRYTFQVTTQAADTTPPQLTRLAWSGAVTTQGAAVTITAAATASDSGVASAWAEVVPVQDGGDPLWHLTVRLVRQADGSWAGTFLAPVAGMPHDTIQVDRVHLEDAAGNSSDMTGSALARLHLPDLRVVKATVSAGLHTDPYLNNLIYIGAHSFLEWNYRDRQNLSQLWDQISTDPAGVKARVNYQLLQLIGSLDDLRKEIYQDPVSHYGYVPYNTSGKWRAVDKAIRSRLRLLTEVDRRAGDSTAPRLDKQDFLAWADILYEGGDWLTPYDPASYADAAPALMASVINTVNRGALWPGMMLQQHHAPDTDSLSFVDPRLIWFQPFDHGNVLAEHYDDAREISLYLTESGTPLELVKNLFHEMGHHFHDVYMTNPEGFNGNAAAWLDYMRLRGNQSWTPLAGWAGRPWENFAEDFAVATLPDDLSPQYATTQAYPRFHEHPEMLQAFRSFLVRQAESGAEPALLFDRPDRISIMTVTPGMTGDWDWVIPGKWVPGATWGVAVTKHLDTKVDQNSLKTGQADSQGKFQILAHQGGTGLNYIWMYLKRPGDSAAHERLMIYLVQDIELYGLPPRATRQPVAGYAVNIPQHYTPPSNVNNHYVQGTYGPPTTMVRINGETVSVDAGPRFFINGKADPNFNTKLQPGENNITIDVTPDGDATKAYQYITQVYYEPPTTKVPLAAHAPAVVTDGRAVVTGTTTPYAMVYIGDATTAADQYGSFALSLRDLHPGDNYLYVVATSPGGNSTHMTLDVTYTLNPTLTMQVPTLTNEAGLQVTGSAPGASRVNVNGIEAQLDSNRNFTATVRLSEGDNEVEAVATDDNGNSMRLAHTVTLNPALVPLNTSMGTVPWVGTAPSGTRVSFQGQPVNLDEKGGFHLTLPLTHGGSNTFRLDFTPASGDSYYQEVKVMRALVADVPAYTNVDRLTVTGSTDPSFRVFLKGPEPVPLGTNGAFQKDVPLNPGPNHVEFTVESIAAPWAIQPKPRPSVVAVGSGADQSTGGRADFRPSGHPL